MQILNGLMKTCIIVNMLNKLCHVNRSLQVTFGFRIDPYTYQCRFPVDMFIVIYLDQRATNPSDMTRLPPLHTTIMNRNSERGLKGKWKSSFRKLKKTLHRDCFAVSRSLETSQSMGKIGSA